MRARGMLSLAFALLVGSAGAHGCAPVGAARAPSPTLDAGGEGGQDSDADADADASPADADADANAADADASPADAASDAAPTRAAQGRCPEGMAHVGGTLCIDRWEASLVVVARDGSLLAHPHNQTPSETDDIRAVSQPGVLPQTYVSALQAEDACAAADKRLCTQAEWSLACEGAGKLAYPYGAHRAQGTCNDDGRSAVGVVFPGALAAQTHAHAPAKPSGPPSRSKGRAKTPAKSKSGKKAKPAHVSTPGTPGARGKKRRAASGPAPGVDLSVWTKLNDPRLGEVEGTFVRTGERALCKNELEVYDLVGNAHEWVADELPNGNGVFAGGYFLDVQLNGEGCHYRTMAHARSYHDYSTGFRCCKDLAAD